MRSLFYYLLIVVGLSSFCFSQEEDASALDNYKTAAKSVDTDLAKALAELATIRKKVADEKPELARKATEAAQSLRQKKRLFEIATATQASTDHMLEERREQIKIWRDERVYLDSMLAEFTKNYQGTVSLPEAKQLELNFSNTGADGDEGTSARMDLLQDAISKLPQLSQVRAIEGSALDENGTLVKGKFAIAGPIAWFSADDQKLQGLSIESRSLEPEIITGVSSGKAIQSLLQGQPSEIAFDPTLGNAVAMSDVKFSLISYIQKGGFWIYPILLLAAVALISAIIKWVQLIGVRSVDTSVVQNIIDKLKGDKIAEATMIAANVRHPARNLLEAGIDTSAQPIEDVEETLYEKFLEALPGLQKGLPLIAIASATAPLLGLLGTVTGMIKTFALIEIFGTGDAQSLSGGISEALITTAFGLIVAIPALIMHALLSRKIQGIRSTMEVVSLAFVNGLKQKAIS